MTLDEVRTAIGDALSSVDGVSGYAFRPTTARMGDGWPLLGSLERDAANAFFVNWRVLIMLPQDERAASDWIDIHLDDLFAALEPVGYIERFEPVVVTTSSGDQFFLQITLRGEG